MWDKIFAFLKSPGKIFKYLDPSYIFFSDNTKHYNSTIITKTKTNTLNKR